MHIKITVNLSLYFASLLFIYYLSLVIHLATVFVFTSLYCQQTFSSVFQPPEPVPVQLLVTVVAVNKVAVASTIALIAFTHAHKHHTVTLTSP